MNNNTQTTEPEVVKPLKGKYDRRRFNGDYANFTKSGPKSQYYKRLSNRSCNQVLKEMEAKASLASIYAGLIERGELFQAAQIRFRVEDRLFGKPYQATNPEERKSPNILNDNRLQIAVQQLLPNGKEPKAKRSKAKALPEASTV